MKTSVKNKLRRVETLLEDKRKTKEKLKGIEKDLEHLLDNRAQQSVSASLEERVEVETIGYKHLLAMFEQHPEETLSTKQVIDTLKKEYGPDNLKEQSIRVALNYISKMGFVDKIDRGQFRLKKAAERVP